MKIYLRPGDSIFVNTHPSGLQMYVVLKAVEREWKKGTWTSVYHAVDNLSMEEMKKFGIRTVEPVCNEVFWILYSMHLVRLYDDKDSQYVIKRPVLRTRIALADKPRFDDFLNDLKKQYLEARPYLIKEKKILKLFENEQKTDTDKQEKT